jgi:phosphoglycolate phosphatase
MTLRLVVFDVDGTLVDSQRHILSAMQTAFAKVDLTAPTSTQTLSIVGLSLPQAVARLAPDQSAAMQAEIVQGYKTAYMDMNEGDGSSLYPGALEAVRRLSAIDNVVLGIATGKSRRGLVRLLAHYDIGAYFVTSQVADDHPSKPNPSMLLQTLRDTGVAAGNAVMIGDTTFDIEMGVTAGFNTIGACWGYHPKAALQTAGANHVINGFEELDGTLAQMWGH